MKAIENAVYKKVVVAKVKEYLDMDIVVFSFEDGSALRIKPETEGFGSLRKYNGRLGVEFISDISELL